LNLFVENYGAYLPSNHHENEIQRTIFTKVRIDMDSMTLIADDFTFATSYDKNGDVVTSLGSNYAGLT